MIAFGGRQGPHRSGSRCRGRPIERREAGREGCLWPNAASQGRPPDGSGGETERALHGSRNVPAREDLVVVVVVVVVVAATPNYLRQASQNLGKYACLWFNLQLVHRFEDYRGTRIINSLTNILMHRLDGMSWRIHTAHVTWVQAAGETMRTARSARGNTRVRGRGRTGRLEGLLASLTSGSAHCTGKPRGSGWDSGRTKLPNPRAPPMPSDAD